jgi:transcriptional regulator with XRE-family HTH domain
MTPTAFKSWRKAARLSQAGAADALGISARNVFAYEHDEKPVPLTVRLACAAYALGLRDYAGVPAATHLGSPSTQPQ